MGIKKKKTFTQIVAVWTLSHFSKISNDCKSNVSAHQSCTIDLFRGACAVKGNVPVTGYAKRVDHGDV